MVFFMATRARCVKVLCMCLTIFIALGVGVSPILAKASPLKNSKKASRRAGEVKKVTQKDSEDNYRKWEFRTAPIAFAARWITFDTSFRLSKRFALGPSLIIYNSEEGDRGGMLAPAFRGNAYGINGVFYFKDVTQRSWYMSFHSYYEKFDSYGHGSLDGEYSHLEGLKTNVALGYRWKIKRFSIHLGGGAEYRNHNETQFDRDENDNIIPTPEFVELNISPFLEFKVGFEI